MDRDWMEQQALLSGFAVVTIDDSDDNDDNDKNTTTTSKNRTWKLPPFKHGQRAFYASVLLDDDTLVIIGGFSESADATNSVIGLPHASSMHCHQQQQQHEQQQEEEEEYEHQEPQLEWFDAPSMNDTRWILASVVCNGFVYAIGGFLNETTASDTMERLSIDTFTTLSTREGIHNNMKNNNNNNNNNSNTIVGWERLNTRLSCPRGACAAVCVRNRFLVVMGGFNGGALSSVDVVDTKALNGSDVTVTVGPSMSSPRYCFGATVYCRHDQIWVIGGHESIHPERVSTMEMITFNNNKTNDELLSKEEEYNVVDDDNDDDNNNNNGTTIQSIQHNKNSTIGSLPRFATSSSSSSFLFPLSSVWRRQTHLELSIPRAQHAFGCLGSSCLIVCGGRGNDGNLLDSMEVIDPQRGVVWTLPDNMTGPSSGECFLMSSNTLSSQLLLLSATSPIEMAMERLPYVELSMTEMLLASIHKLQQDNVVDEEREDDDDKSLHNSACSNLAVPNQNVWNNDGEDHKKNDKNKNNINNNSIGSNQWQIQQLCHTLLFFFLTKRNGADNLVRYQM